MQRRGHASREQAGQDCLGARTETASRAALFGVLVVALSIAVAIYSRSQDVKPSDEMRARAAV